MAKDIEGQRTTVGSRQDREQRAAVTKAAQSKACGVMTKSAEGSVQISGGPLPSSTSVQL
jgi:hypothetical protein